MMALLCSILTAGLVVSLFCKSPMFIVFAFVLLPLLVGAIGDPDGKQKSAGADDTDASRK